MKKPDKRFKSVLVIGCNGQLGRDMMICAREDGQELRGVDLPEIDITNLEIACEYITKIHPEIIINCAAYATVDACEDNSETAFAANEIGPLNLARCAKELDAKLVHISTDYVFDGFKKSAYIESDNPNPQSVYGKSKLAGENRIADTMEKFFIFRIAWLYGNRGKNFVKTIKKIAIDRENTGQPLKVVHDQIGSPTYTMEVCKQILSVVQSDNYGIYHCTAEGSCSWYEFTSHIVAKYGITTEVQPCTTEEFPRPASRPANSVLENQKLKTLGIHCMKEWKDAFSDFLEEEEKIKKGIINE